MEQERVIELAPAERGLVAELFSTHQRDRVLIDSTLEGHFGSAYTDSREEPTVARLNSGGFTMLAGDPASPAALDLLRLEPIEYVTPQTEAWRALLEAEFAGQIETLPFAEYLAHSLDALYLARLSVRVPAGYMVYRVDAALAERLEEDTGNGCFLENFHSTADFIKRGIGFSALAGERVVAAACSMAASSKAVDIEIMTVPEHRRRGLGTALAARLALACLARGLVPIWLAANPASERLALRLGCTPGEQYETLAVRPAVESQLAT